MRRASAIFLVLLSTACGEKKTGRIELEFAPPGPESTDARGCVASSVTVIHGCLELSLCSPSSADGGGACSPVPVTLDRMFDSPQSSVIVPIEDANELHLAAMVGTPSSAPLQMRAVLYDQASGRAVAAGTRSDLTSNDFVGDAPVRLRLNSLDRANCAGLREQGGVADRALHVALPLPNGDVLLLGGVRGEATSDTTVGARLQPVVEVYDHGSDCFIEVGTEGMMGFARVLFAATLIGVEHVSANHEVYRITSPAGSASRRPS